MGHNQVYSRTLQSLVTPNGLIARLGGPYDGKKHDSRMLADSGLLEFLAITFFAGWSVFLHLWGLTQSIPYESICKGHLEKLLQI